ncbi:transforming growth factor-beta-induced protein ig-h3-like [Babylonia areolata]|uniref:transforming growth factor-beta-induced protein ig-h3-like n=1 Tax=Babylonia areolata TaxID=304850 RepID=UPI003FD2ABBC
MIKACLFALLLPLTSVLGADLLTVAADNGCRQIVDLIHSAGLDSTLRSAKSVTLFAPSDDAMARVPTEVLDLLQHNATLLSRVLQFHAVPQVARAADVTNDLLLPTLAGGGLKLRMNVYTSSVVDVVSLTPVIQEHRTKTVVTAEGSAVIRTDLAADNGIVHVIDKVIYPLPSQNIPIVLTFEPHLSSLAYLIFESTLTDTLAGEAFTVFAPSNAALNKLSGQLYNDLLMNLTRLQELVNTHVVRGVMFSSGLTNGKQLTNVQGTQLSIHKGQGEMKVNHIAVTRADIPASNGVIHVIDTVIMPK